jgi:hypothetical protein
MYIQRAVYKTRFPAQAYFAKLSRRPAAPRLESAPGRERHSVSFLDPGKTDHAFSTDCRSLNNVAIFSGCEQGDDPACDEPGVI